MVGLLMLLSTIFKDLYSPGLDFRILMWPTWFLGT